MPDPLTMLQNEELHSVLSLLAGCFGLRRFIGRHCLPDVLQVIGELLVVRILLLQHVQHLRLQVNAQLYHLIDFGLLIDYCECCAALK